MREQTTAKSVRIKVQPDELDGVVHQIVARFHPSRIILFGSYAYGAPSADSDLDLLVVLDTPLKETEQAVKICQAIHYDFGLDLIVRTPGTLTRRLELGDPFLREIIEKGKVLYESADSRVGG
ncbi:MAG: nucleotidyltransferase domain-containing protein [Chloroflexi bacterium]|nr:nucleotidyltransferase domain-containing protein [Chloroflexota bacterium]